MMSWDPPGANPITMRSGFAVRSCASAGPARANPTAHANETKMRVLFFMLLPMRKTRSFGFDAGIFHDFTPTDEFVAHERGKNSGAGVGFRIDAGGGELAGDGGHGNG